jgi:hypothetical protein
MYRNFRTDARYFPFKARKETHEQHKTKIDIDEFRSGTTNITQGCQNLQCMFSNGVLPNRQRAFGNKNAKSPAII